MNYHLIAQVGFVVLTVVCLTVIYFVLKEGMRDFIEERRKGILQKYVLGVGVWLIILSVASLSGFSNDFSSMPPRPFFFIVIPAIVLVFISKSKTTAEILSEIPPARLLQLQCFRIPVELLLWCLFLGHVIPIQMTFEGYNWDILVGITGPIMAILCFGNNRIRKPLAIIWNIGGLILLANIVTIAVLSMPTPLRMFMNEPVNTEVAMFPVIFLPTILVPMAYYLHILSIKQLLQDKSK